MICTDDVCIHLQSFKLPLTIKDAAKYLYACVAAQSWNGCNYFIFWHQAYLFLFALNVFNVFNVFNGVHLYRLQAGRLRRGRYRLGGKRRNRLMSMLVVYLVPGVIAQPYQEDRVQFQDEVRGYVVSLREN